MKVKELVLKKLGLTSRHFKTMVNAINRKVISLRIHIAGLFHFCMLEMFPSLLQFVLSNFSNKSVF